MGNGFGTVESCFQKCYDHQCLELDPLVSARIRKTVELNSLFFFWGEVSRQTGEPEEPHSSTLWNFHCRMGGARVPRKSKKDLFLLTLVQHLGGDRFVVRGYVYPSVVKYC